MNKDRCFCPVCGAKYRGNHACEPSALERIERKYRRDEMALDRDGGVVREPRHYGDRLDCGFAVINGGFDGD